MATKLSQQALVNLAVSALQNGEDDTGFCTICGTSHSGIEPDAENYTCVNCDSNAVCGAEQIVLLYGDT